MPQVLHVYFIGPCRASAIASYSLFGQFYMESDHLPFMLHAFTVLKNHHEEVSENYDFCIRDVQFNL